LATSSTVPLPATRAKIIELNATIMSCRLNFPKYTLLLFHCRPIGGDGKCDSGRMPRRLPLPSSTSKENIHRSFTRPKWTKQPKVPTGCHETVEFRRPDNHIKDGRPLYFGAERESDKNVKAFGFDHLFLFPGRRVTSLDDSSTSCRARTSACVCNTRPAPKA
jgi:hypothetical protein